MMGFLMLISSTWAAENAPQGSSNPLQQFFELQEKLPEAVCDEGFVSRAPTLATLASGNESTALYETQIPYSEQNILQFLMEDSQALWVHPKISQIWENLKTRSEASDPLGQIKEFKRRLSLEVCTALVSPGEIEKLYQTRPELFFPLKVEKEFSVQLPSGTVLLKDSDGRFGKIQKKWQLSGWIEPHEVILVKTGKRLYRRFSNPITNQTRFIQVMTEKGVPLGYFYPAHDRPRLDWQTLSAQSESEVTLKHKIETYRMMIEEEAYRALSQRSEKADAIRKLQEFYKSYLNAYQIYPEDERFQAYGKKGQKFISLEDVKKILDENFFKTLRDTQVNGAFVALYILKPDPKLHQIYEEFQNRLKKL